MIGCAKAGMACCGTWRIAFCFFDEWRKMFCLPAAATDNASRRWARQEEQAEKLSRGKFVVCRRRSGHGCITMQLKSKKGR